MALALLSLAAGCTSALPKTVSGAPVLSVVTGLWPLANLVQDIGGDKVAVDDPIPPGIDPLTYRPSAPVLRIVRSAGLVIDAGGGLQPGFEQAARGAQQSLSVATQLGAASPYVWLDPTMMEKAVTAVTDAMAAADPQAGPLFRRNAGGVGAALESLKIDYSTTLSSCPGDTMVTPDRAFTDMASEFGLTQLVVGPRPSPAVVSATTGRIQAGSSVALVSEPWVDNNGIRAVAAASSTKITALDTLAGTPTRPPSGHDPYTQLMEQNLGHLSAALGCNNNEQ